MHPTDPTPLLRDANDDDLVQASREGSRDAFAELFQRYRRYAYAAARRASSRCDPDDIVNEAFSKVWSALCAGKGPTGPFRVYLSVAIRNVVTTTVTKRREVPVDLRGDFSSAADESAGPDEVVLSSAEARTVIAAFRSLPQRWRDVLWLTEVEGRSASEVAKLLGVSANAASAIAMRSRDGLRNAWLQRQVGTAPTGDPDCDWVRERVALFARRRLRAEATQRAQHHIDSCGRCAALISKFAVVAATLKSAALIVGVGGSIGTVASLSGATGGGASRLLSFRPASWVAKLLPGHAIATAATVVVAASSVAGAGWLATKVTTAGSPSPQSASVAHSKPRPSPTVAALFDEEPEPDQAPSSIPADPETRATPRTSVRSSRKASRSPKGADPDRVAPTVSPAPVTQLDPPADHSPAVPVPPASPSVSVEPAAQPSVPPEVLPSATEEPATYPVESAPTGPIPSGEPSSTPTTAQPSATSEPEPTPTRLCWVSASRVTICILG